MADVDEETNVHGNRKNWGGLGVDVDVSASEVGRRVRFYGVLDGFCKDGLV